MPTALAIEQNDNVRHLIREVLEHARYRVVEAANARQVAEQLAMELPDVIILDCLLGGQGLGLELLRQLHETPRTSPIPVVLMTAVPEPDIDFRLRRCGASAYLQKPFGPRDLVQAVALALALAPEPGVQEVSAGR